MHTLHTRVAAIFNSWVQEEGEEREQCRLLHGTSEGVVYDATGVGVGTLWVMCWCPILQGNRYRLLFFVSFLANFYFYKLLKWMFGRTAFLTECSDMDSYI